MVAIPSLFDPTLEAMKEHYLASQAVEVRDYLGASLIGHVCTRYIWYDIKHYPKQQSKAEWLWAAEDGHRIEDVVADRLRSVPGIELWTHDTNGNQYRFKALGGKLSGAPDGIIRGLRQAPKAVHIWESKCVNHKKYADFQRKKLEYGEKNALEKWNPQYYAQAQINMHFFHIDRHYTTVSLAGGRDIDSCRTEYVPEVASQLIDKAERILSVTIEPPRMSDDSEYFQCKMCDRRNLCHNL